MPSCILVLSGEESTFYERDPVHDALEGGTPPPEGCMGHSLACFLACSLYGDEFMTLLYCLNGQSLASNVLKHRIHISIFDSLNGYMFSASLFLPAFNCYGYCYRQPRAVSPEGPFFTQDSAIRRELYKTEDFSLHALPPHTRTMTIRHENAISYTATINNRQEMWESSSKGSKEPIGGWQALRWTYGTRYCSVSTHLTLNPPSPWKVFGGGH